ncbi:sensor histidine kinase [Sulfuriferula plumbiphila]|uniref:sensor histidine kinase n=1 Tax=Sulfuriferula plumbiphila TaxID=171865 RepID=UPI001CB8E097|nr:cache domain-containing protein [Sulfuriferula plumbiphila]
MQLSVRAKLLFLVLLPLLVVLPILTGLTLYWANTYYDRLLIYKVNSDLAVAHQYFGNVADHLGQNVDGLARSYSLVSLLGQHTQASEASWLMWARDEHKLDFLYLLDTHGRIIAPSSRFDAATWPIVKQALQGESSTAIDIFTSAQLSAIDPALARRALIEIVPTRNAATSSQRMETRGMMIHTATPVYDAHGQLAGVLEGGVLLNQNLDFVDTINRLVYKEGSLPFGSKGTATLFLDDVRIATNVHLFEGKRALGTRVSRVVRDTVLGRGATWLQRAFVVSDWYVSGYEPIQDSFGQRVGMLYVGFLEAPFNTAKTVALAGVILVIVLVSAAGGFISLKWARAIFLPLEKMNQTMSAVEAGDLSARTGKLASQDEIGLLARHFDQLLEKLQAQNHELKKWADELDRKVVERTAELESANQRLIDTQKQLVMSEKLAAIGELTAGVAHEINNPAAVIQGNLDLLVELIGAHADPVREEIRLINQQIQRIRLIVTNLLQFARPAEFAGYVEPLDVNPLLSDCLVLVRHQLGKTRIVVIQDYRATRHITMNRNELQQVIVNLMVNAIHAMPRGGVLTLETCDWENIGVSISVTDTGAGIAPEVLPRIFDPFFTTRKQHGSGLGLSISYGLLERYGNHISVVSEPGKGATFTVWIRTEPIYAESSVN